ncbi:MAG: hypothetical protein HY789_02805 [Deltaproteobacteria bacterium]|nr:hypothetical protein [Deltaproteobacteria bacterium]
MRKKKKIVKKPDRTPLVLAGIAVCIGFVIFWAARKDMTREEIPDYLIGRWLTSAPGYEDRYLEINNVSLLFATSESTVNEYFIDKTATSASADGKQIVFTIECRDLENSPYRFSLTYEPGNGGTLSFKNQSHITWRKEPPP